MCKILETPISFLKPGRLVDAEAAYASQQIGEDALRAIQDEEISALVAAQEAAGLQSITDGAFRNIAGMRDFWMGLQGVTASLVTSGRVYQDQNAGEVIPSVNDRIAHNPNHIILNNFSFLQGKVGDGLFVRMDIPAPSHFLVELVRNGWYDTAVYPTIDALASDIAQAYADTLGDLYALGNRRLLLIDPSWGRLCDKYGSKRLLQGGIDLTRLPGIMRKVNEDAIKHLPPDMRVVLYVPVESAINEYCADIVAEVLGHQRVDALMCDWQDDDRSLLPLIRQIKPGSELILGVGDPSQPLLDDLGAIRNIMAKVKLANQHINVRISFKGGFVNNTDIIDFSALAETDQWNKIENLISLGRQ